MVSATLERRLGERGSILLTGGAVLTGELELEGRTHEVQPGWLAALGGSFRVLDPDGGVPFIILSSSLGLSQVHTEERGVTDPPRSALWSYDLRFGFAIGWSLFDTLNPYAVARAFGGPVIWELDGSNVTGSDKYHYQVGAGLLVSLPANLDVFVEGIPLGERAVTVGVGIGF